MSEAEIELNERLLGELVAGTLSEEDFRRTLLALERQPLRWRDCALAFLEDQVLSRELKTMAACDLDWHQPPAPTATNERITANLPATGDHRPCLRTASPEPARRRSASHRRLQQVLTLAALLLVGFSVGWLAAEQRPAPVLTENRPVVEPATIAADATHAPVESPATDTTPADTDMSNVQFVSEQIMPLDMETPAGLRELERSGRVRVESFDAMVPVSLSNGSSALVPVQQFRVVSNVFAF